MTYSIKKLTPDDVKLARELLESWYFDEEDKLASLSSENYLQQLLERPNFHLYVALHQEKVVGGLSAYELPLLEREASEMFLYEMEIHPEHRRQGLGRRLIEALQTTCQHLGIGVIFVGTSMDNEAAQQLYSSTGGQREDIPWYTYEKNVKHDE